MLIRNAVVDDLDAVQAVHRASIRELCKGRYTTQQIEAWTSALSREAYLGAMEALDLVVAEEDGEILALCILDVSGADLKALYVSPQVAGRGVGSRLLRFAENAVRRGGATEFRLQATLNAVPFYEAQGFVRGAETEHALADGTRLACVAMTKTLA